MDIKATIAKQAMESLIEQGILGVILLGLALWVKKFIEKL